MNLQLQALDHVTIIVADLDATRSFYVDQLGLTEVERPKFDFPGAWFAVDPASVQVDIHATVTSDLAGKPGWGDREVKRLSRGHHFAFRVQDARSCEAFLIEKGVEIAAPCKSRPDGPIQFYVRDPDGHVVELFSL